MDHQTYHTGSSEDDSISMESSDDDSVSMEELMEQGSKILLEFPQNKHNGIDIFNSSDDSDGNISQTENESSSTGTKKGSTSSSVDTSVCLPPRTVKESNVEDTSVCLPPKTVKENNSLALDTADEIGKSSIAEDKNLAENATSKVLPPRTVKESNVEDTSVCLPPKTVKENNSLALDTADEIGKSSIAEDKNLAENATSKVKEGYAESLTESMSISTEDRFQVRFVTSGTNAELFEYVPWKIQLNESNGVHSTLHDEVVAVLGNSVSTKEVFSPFHNRNYQELHSYLVDNDFFYDSLECICKIPQEAVLSNDKVLKFMAYFVQDFVQGYGKNCLKHHLLHNGHDYEDVIRYWDEDCDQIPGMIKSRVYDEIDHNEEDEITELCLIQTSQYKFRYNHVRKCMSELNKAYKSEGVYMDAFGDIPIAMRLIEKNRKDLLSIFYFACHHYSIFVEEFQNLIVKKQWMIPQLIAERYGRMIVLQELVYNGSLVHCLADEPSVFEEGIYVSHWFCPFLLHPMLERKEHVLYRDNCNETKVWTADFVRLSAHSCMILYWNACYFHYEDHNPKFKFGGSEGLLEMSDSDQSDLSVDNEISINRSKRDFCLNLKEDLELENKGFNRNKGYNRMYLTCYGDAIGDELGFYGEDKVYIMEYTSNCLFILDDDGKVQDLRECRAKDLDFHDAKNLDW